MGPACGQAGESHELSDGFDVGRLGWAAGRLAKTRISRHTQSAGENLYFETGPIRRRKPFCTIGPSFGPLGLRRAGPPSARRAYGGQAHLAAVPPAAGILYPVASRPPLFLNRRTHFAIKHCWAATWHQSAPPAARKVRHSPHFDRSVQLTASIRHSEFNTRYSPHLVPPCSLFPAGRSRRTSGFPAGGRRPAAFP